MPTARSSSPYQGYAKNVVVQIDSGMPVAAIGEKLQRQGVIANAAYFKRYYRMFFAAKKLKAGEYLFDGPLSMRQVIEKLEQGKAILYKITVKEGLWIGETAQVFEAAGLFPAAEFHARRRQRAASSATSTRRPPTWKATFSPTPTWCARTSRPAEMAALMVGPFPPEFQQHLHLAGARHRFQRAPGGDPGLADRKGDRQPRRALPGLIGVSQPPDAEHAAGLRLDHRLRPEKGRALPGRAGLGRPEDRLRPSIPACTGGCRRRRSPTPATRRWRRRSTRKTPSTSISWPRTPSSHYFSKSLAEHNRAVRKFIIQRKEIGLD